VASAACRVFALRLGWQVLRLAYGGGNVALWIGLEQPPHRRSARERRLAAFSGGIEQVRNNGVAGNVDGHIFFRIVGAHLLLMGALLKDRSQRRGIERPLIHTVSPVPRPRLLLLSDKKQGDSYRMFITYNIRRCLLKEKAQFEYPRNR